MQTYFIDSIFFTILYPLMLVLSILAGYIIARRVYIRKNKEWKPSGIESSVIAIFALLLSFTFLSSNNSMKARLDILQNGADAVANLRRQSLFFNDDIKDSTRTYLVNYLQVMENFANYYVSGEKTMVKDVETLNGHYLTYLQHFSKQNSTNRGEVLEILPFFNQLNGHFYQIVGSYDIRTPKLIIMLLLVSSLLIGMLVGFLNGFHKHPHFLVPIIFVVLVTMCIQAIRDLDNPYKGSIQPEFTSFTKQKQSLLNSTR